MGPGRCDRWIRGRSSCAKAPLSSARGCFILACGRARAFPLRGPPAVSYPDERRVRRLPRDWRGAHAVVNPCLGAKPIDGPHAIGLCAYGYDPANRDEFRAGLARRACHPATCLSSPRCDLRGGLARCVTHTYVERGSRNRTTHRCRRLVAVGTSGPSKAGYSPSQRNHRDDHACYTRRRERRYYDLFCETLRLLGFEDAIVRPGSSERNRCTLLLGIKFPTAD